MICADTQTCRDISGQAALLTAVVTARRAFGTVTVLAADPAAVLTTGIFTNQTIANAVTSQGAQLIQAPGPAATSQDWPVLLLGPGTPGSRLRRPREPDGDDAGLMVRMDRAGQRSVRPVPARPGPSACLAAIAAAALGVSEAFGAVRARPGQRRRLPGHHPEPVEPRRPTSKTPARTSPTRPAPGGSSDSATSARPAAWVISWLPYADPADVEITLQDTGRTTPANYSTGVLTPEGSDGVLKTRLVAAALENAGFTTRIIERRADASTCASPRPNATSRSSASTTSPPGA